jgi:hypothetical protein
MDDVAVPSAVAKVDPDHYALIAQMVAIVSEDRAQLRQMVYELARRKLRRDLYPQFEEGNWVSIRTQMDLLEAAIHQVESDCAQKSLTFAADPPLAYRAPTDDFGGAQLTSKHFALPTAIPGQHNAGYFLPPQKAIADDFFSRAERLSNRLRGALWWQFQLILAALLGIAAYAAVDGRSLSGLLQTALGTHQSGKPPVLSTANSANAQAQGTSNDATKAASVRRPTGPNIPLPSEYGGFAFTNGQLTELELLPMRVPDQRVAISPAISTPSRTHLPAGKLEFVLFRRDLANAAPDRVAVRVIAQVVRALTFDPSGKPITAQIADTWVVRSNAYQMRVAPVPENPEMISIRPNPPDFIFPAGRYALVLKGAGYDFTIDGPTTDTAHCLERTDALASSIYNECRAP